MAPVLKSSLAILCLAMLLPSPAIAQTQIDIDWQRVNNCAALNRFVGRYGGRNGYTAEIPRRRAQLCRRPPVPRQDQSSPVQRGQPVQPVYLTGSELADLYQLYWFCYDYDRAGRSCSTAERLIQRLPAQIDIHHYQSLRISAADGPNWGIATIKAPEWITYDYFQRLTLLPFMLCRTREQEIDDSSRLTVSASGDGRTERLENTRAAVTFRQNTLADQRTGLRCSRYRRQPNAPDGTMIISEEFFVGGVRSGNVPNIISLLPLSQGALGLRSQ